MSKHPFAACHGPLGWGVWDNRTHEWAVSAVHGHQLAEHLATAMIWAYAAGSADTVIREAAK